MGDLVGEGAKGWLEARQRFDATRGTPFGSYVRHSIRGRILDHLRAVDFTPHSVRRKAQTLDHAEDHIRRRHAKPTPRAMAEELGVDLDDYHRLRRDAEPAQVLSLDAPVSADNPAPLVEQIPCPSDLEDDLETREVVAVLYEELDRLPRRERLAINRSFFQGWPLKRVGNELGVSESRACQIVGQGVKRLRRRLRLRLRSSGPTDAVWPIHDPVSVRPA